MNINQIELKIADTSRANYQNFWYLVQMNIDQINLKAKIADTSRSKYQKF